MRRISEKIVGRMRGDGAPCAVGRLSPATTKTKSPPAAGETTGALMALMFAASVIASKKFMFADLNGTTIAYEQTGDGLPLLLLNGVMMTMQSWALQVPRLSARFRCVLHDFRGQLRSGKPGA